MDITFLKNFEFINGKYILSNLLNLHNMDDVLKWCYENEHQQKYLLIYVINYGFKYYLDSAKYLQNEFSSFLYKNKDKFNLNKFTKDEIQDNINNYITIHNDINPENMPNIFE